MQNVQSTYRPLLKLALPIVFIQICQASLGMVDTMIAGQYHYRDLAGVGLGANIWSPLFVFFMGVLYVLVPKLSAASGQSAAAIRSIFQQSQRGANYLSVLGFVLVQAIAFIAPYFIEDKAVADITRGYLFWISFSMPGLLHLIAYRLLCEGSSVLAPVMLMSVSLLLMNTVFTYVLVNGLFGLPALGGEGCGLATTISIYITMVMMRWLAKRAVPAGFARADVDDANADKLTESSKDGLLFVIEGFPIGMTWVLEVLAFSMVAFLAAAMGTKVVAAHQVAITVATMVFMIPVSLSSAATIRIAYHDGQGDKLGLRRSTVAALVLSVLYAVIMTTLLLFQGEHVVGVFSSDAEVIAIAQALLVYVGVFQLTDALQMVSAGILRGVQSFVKPLVTIFIVYWLLILPAMYVLCVKRWLWAGADVETIWQLLTVGVSLAAVVMCTLCYREVMSRTRSMS